MYLVIPFLKCAWVFLLPWSLLTLVLIFVCVCVSEYFWLLAGHSPWKITHRLSSGGWLCVSHPLPPPQRFASVLQFVPEQWQLDPLDHIQGPQVSRFCDTELHGGRELLSLFPLPLSFYSAWKQPFMLMRMEIWFTFPLRDPSEVPPV